MGILIRPATEEDVPAIRDIYNYEVLNGVATFDLEPKTLEDRLRWFRETNAHPHIVLAAEDGGEIVGWGCLHQFHARAAYRFTTEDSVYVHHDHRGRGIGKLVLGELVKAAGERGFHSVMAGVSEGNEVSIRLHTSFGFQVWGTQREVGYKFDRWLDVTWLQLMLGPGRR